MWIIQLEYEANTDCDSGADIIELEYTDAHQISMQVRYHGRLWKVYEGGLKISIYTDEHASII